VFQLRCGNGCVKISKLEGKRVALWGWGREGRAAFAVLRARLPTLALSLFCPVSEVEAARAETEGALDVRGEPSAEALAAFDVVIKSPGISPYQPIAMAAAGQGTSFIGGTALWFAEHAADDGIVRVLDDRGDLAANSLGAFFVATFGSGYEQQCDRQQQRRSQRAGDEIVCALRMVRGQYRVCGLSDVHGQRVAAGFVVRIKTLHPVDPGLAAELT